MASVSQINRPAYDGAARTLHWLTVLLVVVQFVIGWTMPDVHKDTQPVNLIAWHVGVGATLVAVMAIRVIWRLTHWPAPDELPPLLSVVSRITHVLLYAALILVPLLGWINASSRGWTVRLLGVVPYPPLSEPGSAFGHEMGDVHGILAWVLLALIGLHVVAALFHRFVLKDHVLQRMLPHAGPSRDRGRDRQGLPMSKAHGEPHRIKAIGQLRAAVLGVNDGIISTASLIIGVASAHAEHGHLVLTGLVGLVAGAMATGEYVSAQSQMDTETAALAEKQAELDANGAGASRVGGGLSNLSPLKLSSATPLPSATRGASRERSAT